MAAFIYRGRSLKNRRLKGRPESGDVTLDYSKDPADNFREILLNICKTDRAAKSKRLGYFNALVRMCYRYGTSFNTGLSQKEILSCLRLGLLHETKEMRAACLRALRYYCLNEESITALIDLNIDFLIARSLDICQDNEIERIHAMKLTRKILQLCPHKFPQSLVSVMISISNNGTQEHDKMVRVCLATLCELAFSNPEIVAERGGISTIFKNVLECHQFPRVNESLLATVLFMLNYPRTRHLIPSDIGIEQLLAPFTDSHFKATAEKDVTSSDDDGTKYVACKMAISTLMKSWPGLIRLCKPDGSGLQSLIGVLYLTNMETRKEIMDALCDVFRLSVPEWTDNFAQALLSVDPSEMRNGWKLTEGFVAKEGISILPNLAQTRPNLVDNHMALLLSAFISAGLLEALVEVSTTSEEKVSVRAIILLGELLHMANSILPFECGYHSHCLPTLIDMASSFHKPQTQRNRASLAIKCLDKIHAMKKRGPVPNSLFLDQIIKQAKNKADDRARPLKSNKEMLNQLLLKSAAWHLHTRKISKLEKLSSVGETDHDVNQAIKDSQVLQTKENLTWDWDLVSAILKWPDDSLRKLEDQTSLRFIRRVLFYFKPGNKLFATLELNNPSMKKIAVTGQHFLDFLLECDNEESHRILKEWLGNVAACLTEIKAERAPPDAILSPQTMYNRCTCFYFMYIGRLSATALGDKMLEHMGVYQSLLDLVTVTTHDAFVKVIVSGLDYSKESTTRVILSKALTATSDNCRQYCVQFMRVLLRVKVPFFYNWGMELLVLQLYDQSKIVAMEALTVMSEACEDEANLNTLITLRPSVLHLGYKGALLLARFLSVPSGYKFLTEANYVASELDRWHKEFNKKYVEIVEERLNEALTTYEKTYDGSYIRRSGRRVVRSDVFVPVHIYGQLVQHKEGYQLICQLAYLADYFDTVKYRTLKTDEEVIQVKAALWVVGHIGTSVWGLGMLEEQDVIPDIIKLAEECGIFSIRGTAFYVLGLIASTTKGADVLIEFGWEAVRHKRSERWPVVEENVSSATEPTADRTLTTNLSRVSLTSSFKSEVGGGLVLPIVTLEQPSVNSSVHDLDHSPGASFTIDCDDVSSTCSSVTKTRSNTINTLETLSENGDADVLDIDDGANITSESTIVEQSNEEPPKNNNIIAHEEEQDNDVKIPSTENIVNEMAFYDEDENHSSITKIRSSSTPTECDKKHVIHPRTTSDPRGMNQNKLDSQAAVHFKDPDLSVRSSTTSVLMRNKANRSISGSTEDAGISSRSDPLSFKSSSSGEKVNHHDFKSVTPDKSRPMTPDSAISACVSCESNQPTEQSTSGLSPIASVSSMYITEDLISESRDIVHPSDTLRKMANLKRVPSTKRRFSNPVLSPILKTLHRDSDVFNEYVLSYTSQRDVQGYATLRELKRQRTESIELEPEKNATKSLMDHENPPLLKARSLDFRSFGRLRHFDMQKTAEPNSSISRNYSSTSLQSMDLNSPPSSPADGSSQSPGLLHKVPTLPNIRKPRMQSTGRPEYVGISLPVDVTMVFQINEGEDQRSQVPRGKTHHTRHRVKIFSTSDNEEDDGLEHHHPAMCFGCYKVRHADSDTTETDDEEGFMSSTSQPESRVPSNTATPIPSQAPSPMERSLRKSFKSRHNSLSEIVGSVSSTVSLDSMAKPMMCEDTLAGRVLIRKEVLRLIVNISSSVGTKNSEQALLILKQKFPSAFSDICLYSEVCYMLANYNYRLNPRRFIQELFQDASFTKIAEEPSEIASELSEQLGITPQKISETQILVDRALDAIT